MLVISERKGDKITIGQDITINILEIKNGKVKLGIQAPKDVAILRADKSNISAKDQDLTYKKDLTKD